MADYYQRLTKPAAALAGMTVSAFKKLSERRRRNFINKVRAAAAAINPTITKTTPQITNSAKPTEKKSKKQSKKRQQPKKKAPRTAGGLQRHQEFQRLSKIAPETVDRTARQTRIEEASLRNVPAEEPRNRNPRKYFGKEDTIAQSFYGGVERAVRTWINFDPPVHDYETEVFENEVRGLLGQVLDMSHRGGRGPIHTIMPTVILIDLEDNHRIPVELPPIEGPRINRNEAVEELTDHFVNRYTPEMKRSDANRYPIRTVMLTTFFAQRRAGCAGHPSHVTQLKGKVYNPPSNPKTHNCFFYCLLKFLNKEPTEEMAEAMRAGVGLEKGKMVSFDDMKRMNLPLTIKLYTVGNENGFVLADTVGSHPRTMNLIYNRQHVYLVLDESVLTWTFCKDCRIFVKDMQKHAAEHKFCEVCGCCYTKSHEASSCLSRVRWDAGREIRDGKIHAGRTMKQMYDDDMIISADFETFPDDQMEHVVHTVCYRYRGENAVLQGERCVEQFVQFLMSLTTAHILQFFNGSGYDLKPLRAALESMDVTYAAHAVGTKLYKLMFGKISCWDPYLHIDSSLRKAAESYGVGVGKGEFDFEKIRSFADLEAHGKECAEYCMNDCVVLEQVAKAYRRETFELTGIDPIVHTTASGVAWHNARNQFGCDVALPPAAMYHALKGSYAGGRVIAGVGKYESRGEGDRLVHLDVNSSYPASMVGRFPVTAGSKVSVPVGNDIMKKLNARRYNAKNVAMICVDVTVPKNLYQAPLWHKDAKGRTVWDLTDKVKQWYWTDILISAVEVGCVITRVYGGWHWMEHETMPIFKGVIEKLYEVKRTSTGARREVAKINQCSIYGKCLQEPKFEKTVVFKGMTDDVLKMLENEDVEVIKVESLNKREGKMEFTYRPLTITEDMRITKPLHIGSLILSRQHANMNRLLMKIGAFHDATALYYMDTDSLTVHADKLALLADEMHEGLGGLKVEDGLDNIVQACYPARKVYIEVNGDGRVRHRSRGVPGRLIEGKTYAEFVALLEEGATMKFEYESFKRQVLSVRTIRKQYTMRATNDRQVLEHEQYTTAPVGFQK